MVFGETEIVDCSSLDIRKRLLIGCREGKKMHTKGGVAVTIKQKTIHIHRKVTDSRHGSYCWRCIIGRKSFPL